MSKKRKQNSLIIIINVIIVFIFGVSAGLTTIGLAHANLARAIPAPNDVLDISPDQVMIWFTEPIEPGFSQIKVLNTAGEQVDNAETYVNDTDPTQLITTLPFLSNGIYTVLWQNVSTVDGHKVVGSYTFAIGQPLPTITPPSAPTQPLFQSPLEPFFRWLTLLAILALVGGLTFETFILRPVLLKQPHISNGSTLSQALYPPLQKLTSAGIFLFLCASSGQLLIQTANVSAISLPQTLGQPALNVLGNTNWGHLWLWRIGLLILLAGLLRLKNAPLSLPPQLTSPLSFSILALHIASLGLAVAILLTLSLVSHAAATPQISPVAILNDFLHLVATSLWVGGLFHLLLVVRISQRTLPQPTWQQWLAVLIPRFSALALASVIILLITGLYSSWAQVTILPAFKTPYGFTLLIKIGFIFGLLILGALNLLWLTPRLKTHTAASQHLHRSVIAEVILAALLLLVVGFLTSIEPARQVASRQGLGQPTLSFTDQVEGASLNLTIEPGQVGPNTFLITLQNRDGNPIHNATEISLNLTFLEADLGEIAHLATPTHTGQYRITDTLISLAGEWQVDVIVRRPGAFDGRTGFRFQIVTPQHSSATITPTPTFSLTLLGVELTLIGIFLLVVSGLKFGGLQTRSGSIGLFLSVITLLGGILLTINTLSPQNTTTTTPSVNPFIPNTQTLALSQDVYQQHCLPCHGLTGQGNGPAATSLNPPPANLLEHVPLHTDSDLFQLIHNGIPDTSMAPFGNLLTDEEIWQMVNYLRTLPN